MYRAIQETAGSESLTNIDRGVILAGRDKRRDKPRAANTFLKAMRGIVPTLNAKLLTGANDDARFLGWTEDELVRFEAKWPVGTRQRLAFDLSLHSGFRRGDAVKIGRPTRPERGAIEDGRRRPAANPPDAGRVDRSAADRRSHLHHQRAGPGLHERIVRELIQQDLS